MYCVLRNFKDAKDNDFEYKKSDVYPRNGFEPSSERLEYLSSSKNVLGMPVIQKISEKEPENKESSTTEIQLDLLKKAELIELATSKGIEVDTKWNKQEIIDMIRGVDMDG